MPRCPLRPIHEYPLHASTVASYLSGKRLPNGAYSSIYCAGMDLPPSVKDTGWALESFRVLRIAPDRSADTVAWLEGISRNVISAGDVESVFLLALGLRILGGELPDLSEFLIGARERFLPWEGVRFEEEGRLLEFRLWLELERAGPGQDPEGRNLIRRFLETRFLPFEPIDLIALSDGLSACRLSGIPIPALDPESWERYQDPVTGVRLVPQARMATLVTLRAALRIAELYVVPLRYPKEALEYVDSCRTRNGGYGRRPGAVADLESTAIALQVRSLLGSF